MIQFATGGVVAAAAVPDDPVRAYVALFGFYALLMAVALFIFLFAKDARPEQTTKI